MVVMFAVKALGVLRISEEVEIGGIDIHEHGAPAFHPGVRVHGPLGDPVGLRLELGQSPIRQLAIHRRR